MRRQASYVKKYKAVGEKLYRKLQQEANMASQIARLKKWIKRKRIAPTTLRTPHQAREDQGPEQSERRGDK